MTNTIQICREIMWQWVIFVLIQYNKTFFVQHCILKGYSHWAIWVIKSCCFAQYLRMAFVSFQKKIYFSFM